MSPIDEEKLQFNVGQYNFVSPFGKITIFIVGADPTIDLRSRFTLVVSIYFTYCTEVYPILNEDVMTVADVLIEFI